MGHKGHYGEYTGNAKWSKNHADTKVTKGNYKASERDDAAHIDYLKRDIDYDNKHGHSDSSMTSDEKHISKLAGDMKYDKEHHGSPTKMVSPLNDNVSMAKNYNKIRSGGDYEPTSTEKLEAKLDAKDKAVKEARTKLNNQGRQAVKDVNKIIKS